MRRAALPIAFVLALVLALPPALQAQTGIVRGRVTDSTGTGLARANVSVDRTALQTVTNDQGNYELRGVPVGVLTVRIRLIGYTQQAANVTVASGENRQDFVLVATPIGLAAIDVVIGSRARHAAGEELAVPVDIYTSADIVAQGTTETSQILQALSPAVNFPHQSVTDATDIARPFTLRGLSPDHTLVLLNGYRRHQMAVVNTFAYGTPAGSSGVDMNTIPASAIERVEVLRDGAAAQYGSDAIAGVVNVVLKEAPFAPFLNLSGGKYTSSGYDYDGMTMNASGGVGFRLGRGSLSLFGEYLNREPTNRAWADPFESSGTGNADSIDTEGNVVEKRNDVPQPNMHWGDGLERDIMTMANLRLPLNASGNTEFFLFGGYSQREGSGQGYRRYETNNRNWPTIYPLGFLPEFHPDAVDYSAAGGLRGRASGWSWELGASYGHNDFQYNLRNTLNTSLGPSTTTITAPGDDGILGNADDPGIPNQTSFFAGALTREEMSGSFNAARELHFGLRNPVNVALGVQFRRERYMIEQGEFASWVDGGHDDQTGGDAQAGSQVFAGFAPSDAVDANRTNIGVYADLETSLSPGFLAALAGRFESYSDFGSRLTGKLALRYQISPRLTFRGAASTGFRAPGLSQVHFSKVVTNVIAGVPTQVGVYPVGHPAAQALGSRPLQEETSINLSGGVVFSPSERLSMTVDVYDIEIDNRIILGATFDDDTTLAILAANGFGSIGGVQYFTNGLDTRTWGVDINANLVMPLGRARTLEFNAAANIGHTSIRRVDPVPAVLANSAETGLLDTVTTIAIEEERPDWRGTLTALYTAGRLRGLARASYYGKFSSAQPGFCDLCRERYGAKTLFDFEFGYRFTRFEIALGARNFFDTYPDQPSSTVVVGGTDTSRDYNNNFGTFPWAAASPFGYNGRFAYLRVGFEFR